MSTNKRTEDLIKEKFDSREFAFDENAWAEAEKLIAAQEGAGKTKGILLWIFSANVLIGLVALFAWLLPFNGQDSQQNTTIAANNTATEASFAGTEQKTTIETSTPGQNQESAAITVEEQAIAKVENAKTEKPANLAKNQTPKPIAEKLVAKSNELGNVTASSSSSDSEKKTNDNTSTLNSTQPSNPASDIAQTDNETAEADETISQPKDEVLEEVLADNNGEELGLKEEETSNEETPMEVEKVKVPKPPSDKQVASNGVDRSKGAVADKAKTDRAARALAAAAEEEEGTPSKPSGSEGSDNNKRKKMTWPPQIPKPQPPAKGGRNAWSVSAGISLWDPYASTFGARSWNGVVGASAGLAYERALTKRFWFGANAIYWTRGALNFGHVITEGYGMPDTPEYYEDRTIITPSVMHMINVPLYIRYDISRHHRALIGVSGSYLMATTYESKKLRVTPNGTDDMGTRKITGQHPGFNKYDVMMMFGYEYVLTDRLSASARFNYGFYDITKNNYKNITSYDRNITLEFGLKYNFLRH